MPRKTEMDAIGAEACTRQTGQSHTKVSLIPNNEAKRIEDHNKLQI
jgi:hypothetical protein